jgi:hypothetical protein
MDTKTVTIGDYTGGGNARFVKVGALKLYFSYETCIAYQIEGKRCVVAENPAGTTTGRHIGVIDGGNKKRRYPWAEFQVMLQAMLEAHGLAG